MLRDAPAQRGVQVCLGRGRIPMDAVFFCLPSRVWQRRPWKAAAMVEEAKERGGAVSPFQIRSGESEGGAAGSGRVVDDAARMHARSAARPTVMMTLLRGARCPCDRYLQPAGTPCAGASAYEDQPSENRISQEHGGAGERPPFFTYGQEGPCLPTAQMRWGCMEPLRGKRQRQGTRR